jgi:xanthine dehydrogenase accessory factor
MFDDFLQRVKELRANDEPFAVATVVRCERPTSGKPGDKAIIFRDGTLTGWIGGGCAQPIVIKEALQSLKDGNPRLVRVSPTVGAEPTDGITGYTMMCHSGGTLDIFIEPILTRPHLLIFGRSPVAQTLAKLAKVVAYRVSAFAPEASRNQFVGVDSFAESFQDAVVKISSSANETQARHTAIVVATQGEDDEGALEQALRIEAPYIAFVASKKKWEAVSEYLRERGFSAQQLNAVKVPAGLDIGAASPEEIGVSILAEIIQVRQSAKEIAKEQNVAAPEVAGVAIEAKDPICGMMVNVTTAKYVSQFDGQRFYFCCAHCKSTFDKDPSRYVSVESTG